MSRIRSFIQYIFIVIAIAHTFEITASEQQLRKPLSQERSQQEDKQEHICSQLFWKSLNTIYKFPLCCPCSGASCGYSEPSLLGLNAALASNKPIADSRKGRSPLMAAMQQYIKCSDPYYSRSLFENILTQLAQRETRHAEKIKVLRHAIEQSSKYGVRLMLADASINVATEPTLLVDALKLCKKVHPQHEAIIEDLLKKGADRSWAIALKKHYPPCHSQCPAHKVFEEAPLDAAAVEEQNSSKKRN